MIRVLETKWICIGRRHDDKIMEDIFLLKPESHMKGKVAHWKKVSRTVLLHAYNLQRWGVVCVGLT